MFIKEPSKHDLPGKNSLRRGGFHFGRRYVVEAPAGNFTSPVHFPGARRGKRYILCTHPAHSACRRGMLSPTSLTRDMLYAPNPAEPQLSYTHLFYIPTALSIYQKLRPFSWVRLLARQRFVFVKRIKLETMRNSRTISPPRPFNLLPTKIYSPRHTSFS